MSDPYVCARCGNTVQNHVDCPTCRVIDNTERAAVAMERAANRQASQVTYHEYVEPPAWDKAWFRVWCAIVFAASLYAFKDFTIYTHGPMAMYQFLSFCFGGWAITRLMTV